MKLLVAFLGIALLASVALAGQALRDLSWTELHDAGRLLGGHVRPDGALELDAQAPAGATVPILELEDPGISSPVYAITGEVRCEDLRGGGYLEMWSHFSDGSAFFSRTLGRGPLAPLTGSSNWRPFVVPFTNRAGSPPPSRISFGVHLPGAGRVLLRSARLVQYSSGEDPLRMPGQWWSERQGGLLGGVAGSVVGLLGALVGMLAGSGRARAIAFGALGLMLGIGGAALVTGIVALVRAQPYPVYYPLLLIGVLASVLPIALAPTVRRRYADSEHGGAVSAEH